MPALMLRRADWPGLLVTMAIAAAATAAPALLRLVPQPLGDLPLSPIPVAILLGLALAPAARRRPAWAGGLDRSAGPLLKFAVVLIGLRVSLGQVGALGVQALPLVLGALLAGLGLAWGLGRLLGVGTRLTALLGVGSAICGVSAVAATAPALRARAEETGYALACVALFGLVATLLYPWLLGAWVVDGRLAGLVLGAAIHDTSQVIAAALLHEQVYGDSATLAAATVTKLLRNAAMLVVIPAVVGFTLRGGAGEGDARPAFPLFILGFLGCAALRSTGDALWGTAPAWGAALGAAAVVSAVLVTMAMAAIGMGIQLTALRALGIRPALVALFTALGMGATALFLVQWVS